MTAAKITGITVQDFKRVKLVEITPTENGLTIIGGRNAQGKSSVLDAIAYALGGEVFRPSDINNHDAGGNAKIKIEIDGLVVERAGKNGALKITDARGMRGNQTLLNEIISRFALDLGAFMRANDTEKAKLLLKMFPELEQQLDTLKKQADSIREARADVKKEQKRLQYQFDAMPKFEGLPDAEISIENLTVDLANANAERLAIANESSEIAGIENQALAEQDKADRETAEIRRAEKDLLEYDDKTNIQRKKLQEQIEEAKRQLQEFEADVPNGRQLIVERKANAEDASKAHLEKKADLERQAQERKDALLIKVDAQAGKVEYIQEQIKQASETNSKIQRNNARVALFAEIEKLNGSVNEQTAQLEDIERSRKAMLANAQLPLPELSITEEGELNFKSQKWDCMSGSERLKVATAICMKSKPNCGFVLIDGLEAMDPQTLAEFGQFLESQNMQGIGTIVGNNAATVIIEDGMIVSEDERAWKEEQEKKTPEEMVAELHHEDEKDFGAGMF